MFWINLLGAVCGAIAMFMAVSKGRFLWACAWACLTGYTVLSKIFPGVAPDWLEMALPIAACILIITGYIQWQRMRSSR